MRQNLCCSSEGVQKKKKQTQTLKSNKSVWHETLFGRTYTFRYPTSHMMLEKPSNKNSSSHISVQSPFRDAGGAVELQPSLSHASSYETLPVGSILTPGRPSQKPFRKLSRPRVNTQMWLEQTIWPHSVMSVRFSIQYNSLKSLQVIVVKTQTWLRLNWSRDEVL